MKRISIQFFVMFFLLCMQSSIMAVPHDSVITGKEDPEVDVMAVQKAVDLGGSVLLKGTFDFGQKGRVNITKDISIHGETDAQGAPITIVRGGFWTFCSPLPAQLPPREPGPRIGIRGIHFTGALWTPIFLPYCGGANIVDNKITKVRPIEMRVFGKEGMHRQQGIAFTPKYARPGEDAEYHPGAVVGTILVAGNDIDLSNESPEKTMAQGVYVQSWASPAR